MGFQDLSHVHTRGNSQRIKHYFHRSSIGKVGHILFRHNPGDDSLIAMASGHLIAHGKLPFHGHINFNHLDDSRQEFIPFFHSAQSLLVQGAKNLDLTVCPGFDFRELLFGLFPLDANLSEFLVAESSQSLAVQPSAFFGNHILGRIRHLFYGGLSGQNVDNALAIFFPQNPDFIFQVLPQTLDFLLLDFQGPCVFGNTLTREDLDIDHGALNTRGGIK